MSGGGATWSTFAECANQYPCSETWRFQKQVQHHSERNTAILRLPSASVVVSVTSACPGGN